MNHYAAFLRAVNVGGTGKLPMQTLKIFCKELGFQNVQTYIASGNIALTTNATADHVKQALQKKLQDYAGKPIGVVVRTAAQLKSLLDHHPYADKDPKFALTILLDKPPPKDAIEQATGRAAEEIQLGEREIYVYYATGVGKSKLKIPAGSDGTARNLNTLRKMLELVSA